MLSQLDILFNYEVIEMERDHTLNKIFKMFKYQKSLFKKVQNLTELVYYLDQYVIKLRSRKDY